MVRHIDMTDVQVQWEIRNRIFPRRLGYDMIPSVAGQSFPEVKRRRGRRPWTDPSSACRVARRLPFLPADLPRAGQRVQGRFSDRVEPGGAPDPTHLGQHSKRALQTRPSLLVRADQQHGGHRDLHPHHYRDLGHARPLPRAVDRHPGQGRHGRAVVWPHGAARRSSSPRSPKYSGLLVS